LANDNFETNALRTINNKTTNQTKYPDPLSKKPGTQSNNRNQGPPSKKTSVKNKTELSIQSPLAKKAWNSV